MAISRQNHIFVSYSHKDKKFLEDLLKFLTPFNLRLWADPYIKVGDKWERKIGDALENSGAAILLVSQNFLVSSYIQEKELPPLLSAAENDGFTLVCVPVSSSTYQPTPLARFQWLRKPEQPLDLVPKAKRLNIWFEIATQLSQLFSDHFVAQEKVHEKDSAPEFFPEPPINVLSIAPAASRGREENNSVRTLGKLFGVPDDRPNIISRPLDLERIKRALLSDTQKSVGITGVPLRVGMHGQGGIGKSELAKALIHDVDIRSVFADGIFWITVSQQPNMLELMGTLLKDVGAEVPPDLSLAKSRDLLRQHFEEKKCLLVLDDVWHVDHAKIFCQVGPHCRILITTRDAGLLTALGAHQERIDVVDEQTALEILATWVQAPKETFPPEAKDVVKACGRVPLALSLAGAQIRDGWSWRQAAEVLEQGRLASLDHPSGSIFHSLQTSINALPEAEAKRYLELAVFPEDIHIPLATIALFWKHTGGLSELETDLLLKSFARKSLLYLEKEQNREGASFHDLQHEFITIMVDDLPASHRNLLDAYQAILPETDASEPVHWDELSEDEPYLWDHLVYHLQSAEMEDALIQLGTNLRYLAKKLWVKGPYTVEIDIQQIRKIAPTHLALKRLERIVSQDAHLLVADAHVLVGQYNFESLLPTWLSRVQEEPTLQGEVQRLESSFNFPYLKPIWPMPDLPDPALVRTLAGHMSTVSCCAIDPTGRWIVSRARDQLKVWDFTTGEPVRSLTGPGHTHTGHVSCRAIDSTGRWMILVGAGDSTLTVWDVTTGELVRTLTGHTAGVRCCAIDPTGRWVVSGAGDKTLKVWDLTTGELVRTLTGHTGVVNKCAIDPTGRWVVSGAGDKTLKVWDFTTGELVRTLTGHTAGVGCCAIDPTGRWVVSGTNEGNSTLKVWDLKTGETVRTLTGHTGGVRCCAIDPTGQWIVSGAGDLTLKVWDLLATGETVRALRGHMDGISNCAIDPTGRWVVTSGAEDLTLKVWALENGALVRTLTGQRGDKFAIDPMGRCVVWGTRDQLKVWDLTTGETMQTLAGQKRPVSCCAIDPTGRYLVWGTGNQLKVWDLTTGALMETLAGHTDSVNSCAINPTGRWVVSASSDLKLKVWDLRTGALVWNLTGHTKGVESCAIDPTGRWLVSGAWDGTLKIWDLANGLLERTLIGHTGGVWCCAIDPTGRWLVSGAFDSGIRIWDLSDGNLFSLLRVNDSVMGVAWVPNSLQFIAVGWRGIYFFEFIPNPKKK